MAYVKTVWATGDIITAVKLNNAENGIAAAVPLDGSVAMAGPLSAPSVKVVGGNAAALDTVKRVDFPHGVANQKVPLDLGNIGLSGYIEVELTSSWSNSQAFGRIVRLFAVGTAVGGIIHETASWYTHAYGSITDDFAITPAVTWNGSTFVIVIAHLNAGGNPLGIRIRAFSSDAAALESLRSNLAVGAIYTGDATVYPAPVVQLPAGTTVNGRGLTADGGAQVSSIAVTDAAGRVGDSNALAGSTLADVKKHAIAMAIALGG